MNTTRHAGPSWSKSRQSEYLEIVVLACVFPFLLAGSCLAVAQAVPPPAQELLTQARAAWQLRDQPGAAATALQLFERAIDAGGGYQALWEGARAAADMGAVWLPPSATDKERIPFFEKGLAWAKSAIARDALRPEGHLYYAVNLGELVDRWGFWRQLTSAGELRRESELALKYGPETECGLPMTLLGLFLMRVPSAFGGDRNRGLGLLERAVKLCPDDVENHLDLAEGLEIAGDRLRAIAELEWVCAHEPVRSADRTEFARQRAEAEKRLAALKRKRPRP